MIHYLILAHKSPEQLELLAKALKGDRIKIYIHIDGYSDIDLFKKNTYLQQYCVFIDERVKIRWGGFSMVRATLNGFQRIIEEGLYQDDHIIIMSGQDYPLLNSNVLLDKLLLYTNKSIVEYRIQPNNNWNILNRVIKYHFHDLVVPLRFNNLIRRIISLFIDLPDMRNQIFVYVWQRIVNLFLPTKKYLVRNYDIYRGSSWMILGGDHVHYICQFCDTKDGKRFVDSFRTVAGPDEIFFQTLLLNSPYKDDIINDLPWYIDRRKGPGLPRILDESDYKSMISSNKRFARKFDYVESKGLMKLLFK